MAVSGSKYGLSKDFLDVWSRLYGSRDGQRGSGCLRVNAVKPGKMACAKFCHRGVMV